MRRRQSSVKGLSSGVLTALGALSIFAVRRIVARSKTAPGLGRIGKDDGYTYRYATAHPRHRA